jgi:hypothetical protein
MLDPALSADDLDPDRGFASDLPGQGCQQPLDGMLAGFSLPSVIGDEHVPRREEGQHTAT